MTSFDRNGVSATTSQVQLEDDTHEATFSASEENIAEERGHLTSVEAATIAKKAKVKRLVLVHLSQRYEGIPKVILEEAKEVFKNVSIPEDLENIEL